MGRWPHLLGNSPNADELPGVSGGVLSEVQGGQFGAGCLASSFSSVGDSFLPDRQYGNVVKAAVIGGTASEIGGGEFANGAVSGAFTYLFNQALTEDQNKALISEAQEEYNQINNKAQEFLDSDEEYRWRFSDDPYMCGEQSDALDRFLTENVRLRHFRLAPVTGCWNDLFQEGTAGLNQCHNAIIILPNTRWGESVTSAVVLDTYHGPGTFFIRKVKMYSPADFAICHPHNNINDILPFFVQPASPSSQLRGSALRYHHPLF